MAIWEAVKHLGCTHGDFLAAVKRLGLFGRQDFGGTRVWTDAEVRRIGDDIAAAK
jgi:hypothetical protein